MILSGHEIVARELVRNLEDATTQQQPCGIDLTLRQISSWTSAAELDLDNTHRRAAACEPIPYAADNTIKLRPGSYLVDFNEAISVPLDCMASIYPRSSLWRSGVSVSAGVVDAGYSGALGALLEVKNPHGVVLHKRARLAQVIFEELGKAVRGYDGVYQGSRSSAGRDGVGYERPSVNSASAVE
ncbi:hypothetical protein LTR78_005789 [Recurvomyces mirabilis]|uniref:dUTPase n=1 Tax=Recurvomyces mirabilis TaxID=574656 RepID=A0AAE1C1A9_9PEZI|nr:hypothetical protein LTR78_005789 [Recurvomyces mirabilis]KAK5154169.1 hypothetical protein LTS14_006854 [Recurvomyces mirabilis]